MAPKATIKQVAELAGVSIGAVSRFLGGTLNLPEETANRIREAVARTNYTPHASARRLRQGRAETLGFLAPEISNPFFALLASAIAARAWHHGLDLLVWSSDNVVQREIAALRHLRAASIDGLIMITHHRRDQALMEQLKRGGPTVFLDEDVAGVTGSRVFVDNEYGGWLATKTLIDMGHSRIAHVGSPPDLMSSDLRCKGWRRALSEAGLRVPEDYYMSGSIDQNFGRSILENLLHLPEPPTAIFVGADPIAFGIIAACRRSGIRIPEELSIISFDGLPIGELLGPPLSTVAQPIKEMGAKAVDLLVRQIEDPNAAFEHIVLPVALEIRASAAPLPAIKTRRTRRTTDIPN